ncbi:MAG: nucleotidyl transferase AbiEii/AbiGii toxin family protein [Trueperaceae bacterium]|nr:nucleotidyl transferase AbiEii/AbiGii toxin family protein [Trueperaceae bacterium]
MDEDRLLAFFEALARHHVDYVLVGGVAMNVWGLVRATEDVDVFVRTTPDNVAKLRNALHDVIDDPSIDEIGVDDLAGSYPIIRYVAPDGSLIIDILARLGTAFGYDDLAFEVRHVGRTPVRVATPATLHAMKRNTTRLRDQDDATRLSAAFALPSDGSGEGG